MILLTVAIGLLAVVVAAHLLLTLGLATRLRTLQQHGLGPARQPDLPRPGLVVDEFTATDVDGNPLSHADLRGTVLIAFVTTGCPLCSRLLDDLRANPPAQPLIAFVDGDLAADPARRIVALLSGLGRVVVFDVDDPLVRSFTLTSFPTLLRTHAGVVTASGSRLAHLDEPAAAHA
jgi:hypothetical protein